MKNSYRNTPKQPSAVAKWSARVLLGLLAFACISLIAWVAFRFVNQQRFSTASKSAIQAQPESPSVSKAKKITEELAHRIAINGTLPERSALGIGLLGEGQDSNKVTVEGLTQILATELSNTQALGTLRTLVETREEIKYHSELSQSSDPKIAEEARKQLEKLEKQKSALLENLRQAFNADGLELTADQIDALAASPNAENLASLITSFQAIRLITLEMEDRLRAAPNAEHAQRYYGSYCVLLMAMDKIQKNAIDNIKGAYIPKAMSLREEAIHVIDDARLTLNRSLPPEEKNILELNIATNLDSVKRAERLRSKLEKNLEVLIDANNRLGNSIKVARNSLRAMLVRKEIDRLDLNSTREFDEIQKLLLPPMAALNFADPDRPEVSPRQSKFLD